MQMQMTKSQLIEKINEQHSALSKKDVKGVGDPGNHWL